MAARTSGNDAFSRNGHSHLPVPTTILYPETDKPMTQSTPAIQDQPRIPTLVGSLEQQARNPKSDPCDIAEEAMPAMVIGDLSEPDALWLQGHVAGCAYCDTMLHSFERCELVFDKATGHLASEILEERPRTAQCLGMREASYGFMDTPVGPILVAVTDQGVCEVSYLTHHDAYAPVHEMESRSILASERQASIGPAVEQLEDYFSGARDRFDLGVDLHGLTPFTRGVLEATSHVPYGKVTSYGRIAGQIGNPKASRAVGNALGRNPIPIIIPCHRIVLSNGDLGWYTGGTDIKRSLLGIEGISYGAPHERRQHVPFLNPAQ
jgi:methylated-DNA-[protein]-cysteine S-methyltransferase